MGVGVGVGAGGNGTCVGCWQDMLKISSAESKANMNTGSKLFDVLEFNLNPIKHLLYIISTIYD